MRKTLLFSALFLAFSSQINAQLFTAPDTVCIEQNVVLTNNNILADATYYWGFCSGYLANVPTGSNLGSGLGFSNPSDMELARQDGNYYGFVVNKATSELMRLDFGTDLSSLPEVVNFGNMLNTIPEQATSLFLTRDNDNWHLFIGGGSNPGNSSMARIDFGTSLTNTPSSVNFGNLDGELRGPCGIFVARENDNYYGFVLNNSAGTISRLEFGDNISLTPHATDLGNIGALLGPTDLSAVKDETGNWHLFITDATNNAMVQADLGTSLLNTPVAMPPFTFGGTLFGPSSIRVVQDCGTAHAFITNQTSNELTRVDIPNYDGGYAAENLGGLGAGFSNPNAISPVIRIGDELRGFVVNSNNSLSSILYSQCSSASIPSSATEVPPVYTYSEPGLYNVYLVINEGQPNSQVQCHQIRVLPKPYILASNDTLICQGDTVRLGVVNNTIQSVTWSPATNVTDSTGINIGVFPAYTTPYTATILFPGGCIVDTAIMVNVSKVQADAGPDRNLADGAHTVLGGPLTSMGAGYTYFWTPAIEINNVFLPNPTATPKSDITYYLQVTNQMGCQDIDTMIVKVVCNDINLPNAFAPESNKPGANRFGMLNTQVVKLNYLRVYDRWGKLVFETTDPSKAWDGKVNGQMALMGVYVWEADGFCRSGQRIQTSGNVTLLR